MSAKPEPLAGCDLTKEEVALLDRIVTPWLIPHESRIPSDIERLYTYGLIALAERRKILQPPKMPRSAPQSKHDMDLAVWPDGYWCHYHELEEHTHRSDDYECIGYGTGAWEALAGGDCAEPKPKVDKPAVPMLMPDLAVWPDASWCYCHELWKHTDKPLDYQVVPYASGPWKLIMSLVSPLPSNNP